ncbi:MAG: mechanosensitive ion channel family protein [Anaerolineae bacterium]|nr:mechanosensitive ion channel family protein [Anaerolineae bacterium]
MPVFETVIWNNALRAWLAALLVTLFTAAGLIVITRLLLRRLTKIAAKTEIGIDDLFVDLLRASRAYFYWSAAVYVGSLVLSLPQLLTNWLRVLAMGIFLLQLGFWGTVAIQHIVTQEAKKRALEDASAATTVNAFGVVARVVLWGVIVLLILDNLPHVEITTLLASLGIGGIAVALAVQNILGDLFASLSIALDRPFVIGDFITVGDFMGTVEKIGLKSTRVRSISGEQLIFSNTDLLDSRIRNYKRMAERRVVFSIGVGVDTPAEVLERIPGVLHEIVESQPQARFSRAHFKDFGDFTFNYEVVYIATTADYNVFMDVQQAINLAILKRFHEERIALPYPTQSVLVRTDGATTV